jgi:hypothetical protein
MLKEILNPFRSDRRASRKPEQQEPAASQTRNSAGSSWGHAFSEYAPEKQNIGLLRNLRSNIPILNAAIIKRQLLVGSYQFETFGDKGLKEKLDLFSENVNVNWLGQGLATWWMELMDSADECGGGYGELVPVKSGTDVHRLKTCRAEDFRFMFEKETGRVRIAVKDEFSFLPVPLEKEEFIYYLAFNQRDGSPQGYPLLWGLPFVGQIFLRIMKSWDNSAWRFADPSMMVIVKGGKGQDAGSVNATKAEVLNSISSIMKLKRRGQTADVGGAVAEGGDVKVEFLGGDQVIDSMEIPVKNILEQIVSATHIPPSLFGLSWATGTGAGTTTQGQVDILISLINKQRERIGYLLDRVLGTYLTMTGSSGKKFKLEWDEINLQDEVRTAQARKFNAEASEKEVLVQMSLVEQGLMTIQEAEDNLRTRGLLRGKINQEYLEKRLQAMLVRRMFTEN